MDLLLTTIHLFCCAFDVWFLRPNIRFVILFICKFNCNAHQILCWWLVFITSLIFRYCMNYTSCVREFLGDDLMEVFATLT